MTLLEGCDLVQWRLGIVGRCMVAGSAVVNRWWMEWEGRKAEAVSAPWGFEIWCDSFLSVPWCDWKVSRLDPERKCWKSTACTGIWATTKASVFWQGVKWRWKIKRKAHGDQILLQNDTWFSWDTALKLAWGNDQLDWHWLMKNTMSLIGFERTVQKQ